MGLGEGYEVICGGGGYGEGFFDDDLFLDIVRISRVLEERGLGGILIPCFPANNACSAKSACVSGCVQTTTSSISPSSKNSFGVR